MSRLIAALLIAISVAATSAQNRTAATRRSASIAGRVIHADGIAAEGARVVVYAVREGAPAAIVATSTSLYDGRYEVTGLPAGRFVVGVTPQRVRGFGGDSRRLSSPAVETLYPGTTDRLKAQPVRVFDGLPTEGIDVWLEPAAQRYSISGRASWPDGSDVDTIAIEYGGPEGVHHGLWYVHDPGGLFTIEGASRGTYVLLARAESTKGPLLGIAVTEVTDDSVQDVRLSLRAPGTIEGRVVVEAPSGPDLSTLRISPNQTLLRLSPLYPVEDAAVDANGRFRVSNVVGEYALTLHGLPPGWRIRRVTRTGNSLADNRVSVAPGERVTGIEVVIGNGTR
jgi:hypothetical protein